MEKPKRHKSKHDQCTFSHVHIFPNKMLGNHQKPYIPYHNKYGTRVEPHLIFYPINNGWCKMKVLLISNHFVIYRKCGEQKLTTN